MRSPDLSLLLPSVPPRGGLQVPATVGTRCVLSPGKSQRWSGESVCTEHAWAGLLEAPPLGGLLLTEAATATVARASAYLAQVPLKGLL